MIGSAKLPPKLKKKLLTAKQKKQHNFSLGQQGESQAIEFLITAGFWILDTNIRYKNHEVDVVALDRQHDEVVFVEVKTRTTSDFGDPSQAVSQQKIKSMQIVAARYLNKHQLNKDYRFDIIAVLPDRVEHFENVTW